LTSFQSFLADWRLLSSISIASQIYSFIVLEKTKDHPSASGWVNVERSGLWATPKS